MTTKTSYWLTDQKTVDVHAYPLKSTGHSTISVHLGDLTLFFRDQTQALEVFEQIVTTIENYDGGDQ